MNNNWRPVSEKPDLPIGGSALLSIEPAEVVIGRWTGEYWVFEGYTFLGVLGWQYKPEPIRAVYSEVPR